MYVLIVFNARDEDEVDCVLGIFDSYQDAANKRREIFGSEVDRRLLIARVQKDLPDWVS